MGDTGNRLLMIIDLKVSETKFMFRLYKEIAKAVQELKNDLAEEEYSLQGVKGVRFSDMPKIQSAGGSPDFEKKERIENELQEYTQKLKYMNDILSAMSNQGKLIIQYHYFKELSYPEMAEKFGCSVRSVQNKENVEFKRAIIRYLRENQQFHDKMI